VQSVNGSCQYRAHLIIECFVRISLPGAGPQMTVGNVVLNQQKDEKGLFVQMNEKVLRHETVHATQWARYGPKFALLYKGAFEKNGECNEYEEEAGYEDGNYLKCI
jgi:hypothetical protein